LDKGQAELRVGWGALYMIMAARRRSAAAPRMRKDLEIGARRSWGVVDGEHFLDVGATTSGAMPDLRSAIAHGLPGRIPDDATHHALADIRFLPVIPNPDKILCIGLNYESHRLETGRAEVGHPTIFLRLNNSRWDMARPSCGPACPPSSIMRASWP